MNLHRASGRPDWADVPAGRQNVFQQIAAATRGLGTPGNLATIIGFGLVVYGLAELLHHRYIAGGIIIAAGRMCDVADGWLAETTGTKSPLGELLDAGIDKLVTLLTVIVLFISGIAPPWALAALLAPQVIITVVSLKAIQQGGRIHPSLIGKLSMATAWVAMVGFLILAAFIEPAYLAFLVYFVTVISVVFGFTALTGYLADLKTAHR